MKPPFYYDLVEMIIGIVGIVAILINIWFAQIPEEWIDIVIWSLLLVFCSMYFSFLFFTNIRFKREDELQTSIKK